MFEEPEAREKIKNIFKNISYMEEDLIPKFKKSLADNEPIGLYVATQDNTDISWIFGRKQIGDMLGGEEALESITEQLLPEEEDKESGVVRAVLKKVGPIYAIRLEKEVLEDAFL